MHYMTLRAAEGLANRAAASCSAVVLHSFWGGAPIKGLTEWQWGEAPAKPGCGTGGREMNDQKERTNAEGAEGEALFFKFSLPSSSFADRRQSRNVALTRLTPFSPDGFLTLR